MIRYHRSRSQIHRSVAILIGLASSGSKWTLLARQHHLMPALGFPGAPRVTVLCTTHSDDDELPAEVVAGMVRGGKWNRK